MHGLTTLRRIGPAQIKRAAVVFVIATGLAVTTMIAIVTDGESSDRNRAAAARAGVLTSQKYKSNDRFLEQNLHLPTGTISSARTADFHYTFLEQNLDLPASSLKTGAHWKVIEENNWGEDFVSEALFPNHHDVLQQHPVELR